MRAKKKKAPAKKARPKRHKPTDTKQDPPPLMNAIQLGERYNVKDETIRNWAKSPTFPKQLLPGRWSVYAVDRWVAMMREMGGPKAVDENAAEARQRAQAATGIVNPAPPGTLDFSTVSPEDEARISGGATTPAELIRLSQKQLNKIKQAEEIIQRRLANLERKRKLIPRAEFEEWLAARVSMILTYKRQRRLELPPKLVGLERPEIEIRIAESDDELFRRIALLGNPIEEGTLTPHEPAAPTAQAEAPPPDARKPHP